MKLTYFDIKTGKTYKGEFDWSLFSWSKGNGSCDCNRSIECGIKEEFGDPDRCFGSTRLIAVDIDGDLEGHTKEEALSFINESYLQ